ncbi:MAG TPA: tetratricopeptide repeat protein [Candidatus Sulfotelmatobacter sp.]|jgi:Flp pilus assembly protein TadD|nr:tetratricopeptide repeat protein [Candidatus Sulfotelmatobacter sp.]
MGEQHSALAVLSSGGAQREFDEAVNLHRQGKLPQAVQLYRRIIEKGSLHPEPFLNLALAEEGLGNQAEAMRVLRQLTAAHPSYKRGLWALARLLENERRSVLQAIVRQDREDVEAWRALSHVYPDEPSVLQGLAEALWRQRRMDEAAPVARRVIELRPDAVEAWVLLGSALKRQGFFVEAEQAFRKAIALQPGGAVAHWNLSLIRLLFEDYEEGWREFEWRWQVDGLPTPRRDFGIPAWQGEDPAGKRVLVYWEQGFGDTIQMLRYVPELKARGAVVVFEAQPNLVRLLEPLPWIDEVVAYRQPIPPCDLHVPLMSLPRLLGVDPDPARTTTPYLAADPALVEQWRRRLAHCQGLKVGLVWAGNPQFDAAQFRSPGLERFLRLFEVEGVTFLSLQVGEARQDLQRHGGFPWPLQDLGGQLRDFSDTAAAVANLDLVISSDTGVVHLCGAMGTPTWAMISYPADWRWGIEGDRSKWYQSLRLFRQRAWRDDWIEPFDDVRIKLNGWKSGGFDYVAQNL